jgi:lysophospholipase L1-like esterase
MNGDTLIFGKGDKLVMIGDSITDANRQGSGEGLFEAIGRGYVMMVDALLSAAYPELAVRVVNQGKSGNTVRDLASRWQTDVLDLAPRWVSIMIGTNDVWRQFDSPRQPELAVPLDEYERTLDDLVLWTLPRVRGVILMTPFFLEPNRSDAMRAAMDRYGGAVKRIGEKNRTLFCDTQRAFDEHMTHGHSMAVAWDRVHPNHVGAAVLARAFLGAVGFRWQK